MLGCVRLGNPDLDFQNLNLDFPIEREIRKRISPPRNPSPGSISIKKSKSGFFGFPFLSFDWEIRKRICKTVLVNSGLLFSNYAGLHARPLFLRTVLQILFRISQSNDKKGNPKDPDLDFLIEIHPEDGFLGGEIHFRISCSIGKSRFRF